MAKIGKVQEVRLDELVPYAKNAKQHGPEQVKKIADSIREFGFLSPILIDKDMNIIAGHGRVMAAKEVGLEAVPAVFIEGLTEQQRRAYILADNKLTELGGWDQELLSEELQDLSSAGFDIDLTGFNIDDIIITDDMGEDITDIEIDELAKKEPRIKQGEIWILGRHRLMCGDSTNPEDCKKLVGGGIVDLFLTDPPYGVSYVGGTKEAMTIENDDLEGNDLYELLKACFCNATECMKPGASFYIWYSSKNTEIFTAALKAAGLEPREQLVWVKSKFTLGRQDYQWRHEPCLYGWKEGAAHYFIDLRSLSTVQDDLDKITREMAVERIKEMCDVTSAFYAEKPAQSLLHPTMKPVPLFKKLIRNSTRPGEIVLDLFGGSGTTLIAAEDMDRTCYMMEYDPQYAEVIISRWEEATGQKAVKL